MEKKSRTVPLVSWDAYLSNGGWAGCLRRGQENEIAAQPAQEIAAVIMQIHPSRDSLAITRSR